MNQLTSDWGVVLILDWRTERGLEIEREEKLIYRAPAKRRITATARLPEELLQRGMFSVIGLLGVGDSRILCAPFLSISLCL